MVQITVTPIIPQILTTKHLLRSHLLPSVHENFHDDPVVYNDLVDVPSLVPRLIFANIMAGKIYRLVLIVSACTLFSSNRATKY